MITEESIDKAAMEFSDRYKHLAPQLYLLGAFKNGVKWALRQTQSESLANLEL